MKPFKKILVVFENQSDNRALIEQAIDLTQKNQAALTVIDVIEKSPQDFSRPAKKHPGDRHTQIPIIEEFLPDASLSTRTQAPMKEVKDVAGHSEKRTIDILEYVKQEEQRDLQKFVTTIQQAGIQTASKTIVGIPFIEIIREVMQNQYDLVMMTAEGKRGLKQTLLGNTSLHLMRKCPCPVWVIKPGQPNHNRRILAAVDLVPDDKERIALARKIMDLATSLARLGHDQLLILHAWSLFGESILRGRAGVSDEEIENLLIEAKTSHRDCLTELLENIPLDEIKFEVYLLKGNAGTLIPEFAQAKAVDLIVMGTLSRTGIAGFFIGNTAEKVLQQVDCSILAVKPEGFVSPVKLNT